MRYICRIETGCMIALALLMANCASSGAHRVGVVQVRLVMEECTWAQVHMQNLKKEIADRERMLDEQCMTPLQKFAVRLKELEKTPDGDSEKTLVEKEHQRVLNACMDLRQKLQEEVARIRDRFLAEFMEKIHKASKAVAKHRQLDVVLLEQPQGVVSWAGTRVDITNDIKSWMEQNSIE